MKALWILAIATTFSACANRSEDEVGAAPERADSTATATAPKAPSGREGSVPTDSAQGQRTSPAPNNEASGTVSESVPTDSAQGQSTAPAPTNQATEMPGDSMGIDKAKGDSALTNQGVPATDSAAARQ